jgi:hypothetical protein
MNRRRFLGYALGGAAALTISRRAVAKPAKPAAPADTTWFKDAKTGVFCHYLTGKDTPVEAWNKQVDAFDVESLAKQLAAVGTPYFFLTIGQNSGHYCTPNETYDKIVGISPSKCARRDLIADLAAALAAHKIKMMVYLPSGAPDQDPIAMKQLKWAKGGKDRLVEFQRHWEDVIRTWSVRWGKNVHGWWIDGFPVGKMYRYPEAPNFASLAAALKAGNPNSLVAFNPGYLTCHSEYEDYTAGEINTPASLQDADRPLGRWVERNGHKAQFHVLSFLGKTWGAGPKQFSDDLAAEYTKYITSREGVVTWDVPISASGQIPQEFIDQLKVIRQAVS